VGSGPHAPRGRLGVSPEAEALRRVSRLLEPGCPPSGGRATGKRPDLLVGASTAAEAPGPARCRVRWSAREWTGVPFGAGRCRITGPTLGPAASRTSKPRQTVAAVRKSSRRQGRARSGRSRQGERLRPAEDACPPRNAHRPSMTRCAHGWGAAIVPEAEFATPMLPNDPPGRDESDQKKDETGRNQGRKTKLDKATFVDEGGPNKPFVWVGPPSPRAGVGDQAARKKRQRERDLRVRRAIDARFSFWVRTRRKRKQNAKG